MNVYEIHSAILKQAVSHARVGITTLGIDQLIHTMILEYDCASCNLNYSPEWARSPYPNVSCISVNEEIVHGMPSDRVLQNGDLVNIDFAIKKDNLIADSAMSVGIGDVSEYDQKLLYATRKALYAGISKVRDGVTIEVVARAIDDIAVYNKFVVNASFVGHGVGSTMHEYPPVYHARNPYYMDREAASNYQKHQSVELKEGMIICLEPALTKYDQWGDQLPNGWTFATRNKRKSAMFEHCVKVTKDGSQILTSHIQPDTNWRFN